MATCTRAQLATKVMSYLGLKAQGQNPSADDLDLVGGVLDSVIDGLRPTGAVTFATSAVPEWAQWPLTKLIAFEVGPVFGRAISPLIAREARADFIGGSNTAQPMRPAKGTYY